MKQLIGISIFLSIFITGCTTDSNWENEFVTEAWGKWIQKNHNTINSLTSDDYRDLNFLEEVLEGKTLVQLGESGHGVKEFNQVKVRLIKYLHQNLGFNVIAFESSIFACHQAYKKNIDYASAKDFMEASIFGVWHTEEVVELFKYIRETQNSNNPLILAGFDVQPSSYQDYERPQYLKDLLINVDEDYAEEVYNKDSEFILYGKNHTIEEYTQFAKENMDEFINFYNKLATFIETNKVTLVSEKYSETDVEIILQNMRTAYHFVIEMAFDGKPSLEARDEGMAKNLIALKNSIYKDKKIMVWAHNFHIRHNNNLVRETKTMGYWLNRSIRDIIYTIELYMFQGKAAWNNRQIYDIAEHSKDSLEQILNAAEKEYLFVDILNQTKESGNSWMFQEIEAKSWGTGIIKYKPSEQYSGVIFIKNVNPPDYVQRTRSRLRFPSLKDGK